MTIEKGLLIHWWHYYGKCIYTLAELEQFKEIIDKYGTDKVLDAAIASVICEDGSPTTMLASIRNNSVEEMFNSLPNIDEMEEDAKIAYSTIKEEFVKSISETYK